MSTIPLGPVPWPPHLTAAELDADLQARYGADAGPAWYCPTCDDGHVGGCTAVTPPRTPLWRRLTRRSSTSRR